MKISRLEQVVKEEVLAFLQKRYLRENTQSDQTAKTLGATVSKDGKVNTYVELSDQLLKLSRILRQGTAQLPGLDTREIEELSNIVHAVLQKSSETAIGPKLQQTKRFFDAQTKGSDSTKK